MAADMIYGSTASGIEAASVAWEPLGWEPAWFSEIDPFASAVLAARFPKTPNLGDMTRIHEKEQFAGRSIDLLVGGTPCQRFSVARFGGDNDGEAIDTTEGNLALTHLDILKRSRARWLLWENVPGVLRIDGGRAMGSILGALAKLGYGFAYRVLDAKWFGGAHRRRRVYVVGHLGDWTAPARVLGLNEQSHAVLHKGEAEGGRLPSFARWGGGISLERLSQIVFTCGAFRKLTPLEWERAFGFPDNHTLVDFNGKPATDRLRWDALGNSMDVRVMRWIGERIRKEEDR